MTRRSYRRLLSQPAWGMYAGNELIATCRAETIELAIKLFETFGYNPIDVRQLDEPVSG